MYTLFTNVCPATCTDTANEGSGSVGGDAGVFSGPATTSNTAGSGNSGSSGSGGGPGGPNTVAIAVGLAVGIPVIIAAGFLLHRWQKRRRMVKEAVMEKRRAELVIE